MSNRYPRGGPSRASADTMCQKCLQRGHYSYECKASAADRPYVARPSRTQQLLNPKYAPKLSEVAPPEDLTRKAGIADEILARRQDERGRKRQRLDADGRSVSRSSSASSISTISTNRSRSPTPPTRSVIPERHTHHRASGRARQSSASPSHTSPERAGRSRRHGRSSHHDRKARGNLRSTSPQRSRSPRRRHSPPPRRSRTPDKRPEKDQARGGYRERGPPVPRERSLSPYSRRLALTQSMNR